MSTSEDNTVRVFDLRDGCCVGCFREHMSTPTAVAIAPDGYMMASVGRDKVMNVYTLRGYHHVKTIPVMEEMEGVAMLTHTHAQLVLGRAATAGVPLGTAAKGKNDKKRDSLGGPAAGQMEAVVVTAGIKGVLRVFHLRMTGKDAATFSWALLAAVPLHPNQALPAAGSSSSSSSSSSSGGGGGGGDVSSYSVITLHYLPKSGQIAAVTADHNFCFFSLAAAAAPPAGGGTGAGALVPRRQLIGCNDDILDIIVIPRPTSSSSASEGGGNNDSNDGDGRRPASSAGSDAPPSSSSSSSTGAAASFRLALVTNSPQVRPVARSMCGASTPAHNQTASAPGAAPAGAPLARLETTPCHRPGTSTPTPCPRRCAC